MLRKLFNNPCHREKQVSLPISASRFSPKPEIFEEGNINYLAAFIKNVLIHEAMSHDPIFLATCNPILLWGNVKLANTPLQYAAVPLRKDATFFPNFYTFSWVKRLGARLEFKWLECIYGF